MTHDPRKEIERYDTLYRTNPRYRMGDGRRDTMARLLKEEVLGSYLDVGCGRGEMLPIAHALGFLEVCGTDAAESVVYGDENDAHELKICCMAWEQPFADEDFDVVSCVDVLEHLPEQFVRATVVECARVCHRRLLLTAASKPDIWDGVDLHISARPVAAWDALVRECLGIETWDIRHRTDSPTPTSAVWDCRRRPDHR